MSKPAGKDIIEALEYLKDEAEVCRACSELDGEDAALMNVIQAETVIRRLAREAGYDLPEQISQHQ